MGNFDEHTHYGHIAYVLLAVSLAGAIASGGLPVLFGVLLAALAYPFVRLGAAFPDIDHHASRPHRGFRRAVFVIGTITSFFVLYMQTAIPFEMVTGALNVGVSTDAKVAFLIHVLSLGIGFGLRESVSRFRPKHRGITHQVPTGLVVSAGLGGLVLYIGTTLALTGVAQTAAVISSAFFIGFMSHLRCDRMLLPAFKRSAGRVGEAVSKARQVRPF